MPNKTFSRIQSKLAAAANKQNSDLIGRTPCALGQTPYIGARFITMNQQHSTDSLLPLEPGIESEPVRPQRTDAPTALKPPAAPPQTLLSLTQEIGPTASDHQSLVSETDHPHPPDDETQNSQPLTHSGHAKALLDETPFLTMDNRFKLVRASNHEAAGFIADGLSELRSKSIIQSFQQVNVDGQPCFTVALR